MRELLRGAYLVHCIAKGLRQAYPDRPISRTFLQHLLFFAGPKMSITDYEAYRHGLQSSRAGTYINLAEALGFIRMKWSNEEGFLIEPVEPDEGILKNVKTEEVEDIAGELIEKFGELSLNEVIILSYALYVRERLGIKSLERIVDTLHKTIPRFSEEQIRNVLEKQEFINEDS